MKKLIRSTTGYSYTHADRSVFDNEGIEHEVDNWVKAQVEAGILEVVEPEEVEKPRTRAAKAEGK